MELLGYTRHLHWRRRFEDERLGHTSRVFSSHLHEQKVRESQRSCKSAHKMERFDAGVTTIQSHPYVEHLLAVGSYDDKVRLFDARKPLAPLTEVDVGGGAWRVKWHPSAERKDDLLVACMHDGCKVLHFEGTAGLDLNSTVTQRFDEHKSMAYGADWSFAYQKARKGTHDSLIASCSFYDHALHLWQG